MNGREITFVVENATVLQRKYAGIAFRQLVEVVGDL